jgi:hypothetical protein
MRSWMWDSWCEAGRAAYMLSTSSNFPRYPQRRSNGDIDLVAASRLPLFHVLTESHGIPWSSGSRDYLRKQASATLHTSGRLHSHTTPELDRSSHTAPRCSYLQPRYDTPMRCTKTTRVSKIISSLAAPESGHAPPSWRSSPRSLVLACLLYLRFYL